MREQAGQEIVLEKAIGGLLPEGQTLLCIRHQTNRQKVGNVPLQSTVIWLHATVEGFLFLSCLAQNVLAEQVIEEEVESVSSAAVPTGPDFKVNGAEAGLGIPVFVTPALTASIGRPRVDFDVLSNFSPMTTSGLQEFFKFLFKISFIQKDLLSTDNRASGLIQVDSLSNGGAGFVEPELSA